MQKRRLEIRQKKPPAPREIKWENLWKFKHGRKANRKLVSLPKAISDAVRLFTGAKEGEMTPDAIDKAVKRLSSLPESSLEIKRVKGHLTRALLHHPSAQIRINAAILFGEVGLGVPALKAALKTDPNIDVRGICAFSLAHIGSPEVVPALKDLLQDSYSMVRMLSEDSYHRYGDCFAKDSSIAISDKEVIEFFKKELAIVWGTFP